MLLLVVAAGFVFLFQTELRFRDELRDLGAANESLRATRAAVDLELSAAEATRTAVEAARATVEYDNLLLEGQLVDSQQAVDQLTTENEQLAAEVQGLEDQLAELQTPSAPVARIVTPVDEAVLPLGAPVEIVMVASDPEGLDSLTLEIDGRRHSTYSIGGDRLYARTLSWNAPDEPGEHTLAVTARNLKDIASERHEITIQLQDTEAGNAATRARIEANVSELRGLALREPISPLLLTRDELRERLAEEFAADNSPDEARADVLELSAFDFLARDYDLYQAQLDLQSEGILGYYDPETAEFVIITDGALLDPAAQWTHAHEFVHALQDQHFALDDLDNDALDSEARAAIRALAEGEAELVQYLFLFEGDYFSRQEVDAILSDATSDGGDFLRDFPAVLVNNMAFPYTSGVDFVLELYREDGFDAINAAWANPPQSTEHILHPDRYRAGDPPIAVSLPPLTDTLGFGWEQIDEDILGEFFLRQYLDQQLPAATVNRAATGWGGDRYAVYWNEADRALVMALRLLWDTPEDAEEFAAAYPDYARRLYGVDDAETLPDGSACWAGEDVICFRQEEGDSLVVRAPDISLAATVMTALQP